METDFRGEVFKLCKKLQANDSAKEIANLIHLLSTTTDYKDNCLHGDFAQLAKQTRSEFHGFLFLDDNLENVDLPNFFNVEHLSKDERMIIEKGYKTLDRFIELCLSDVAKKYRIVAESMNPYFSFKPVKVSESVEPLVSDNELEPAVSAFKSGKVYKTIMNTNGIKLFSGINRDTMRNLIGVMEKEVNNSLGEDVNKDLKDFSMRLNTKLKDMTDIMFAFSILLIALRESLKISCRLLYRAICGVDLFVLDNDNIIGFEKIMSNIVCEYYKVFSQDLYIDYAGDTMGSIILIDCDIQSGEHMHKFGVLVSESVSLCGEFGQSAKYSLVTVDEQLIHIHKLVDEVLQVGLPMVE